jgi:hypothetical protein
MVKTDLTSSKVSLVFFKSLEVHSDCTPWTTKVLEVVMLRRTDKHNEKCKQETIISGLYKTFIHLGFICT